MHCFTETLEIAQAAMELNFYISFPASSPSRTHAIKEVAKAVPLERMLVETDSHICSGRSAEKPMNRVGQACSEEIAVCAGFPWKRGRSDDRQFLSAFFGQYYSRKRLTIEYMRLKIILIVSLLLQISSGCGIYEELLSAIKLNDIRPPKPCLQRAWT